MDKNKKVEELKKEVLERIRISIYEEIRIYVSLLSEYITKYDWGNTLKNVDGLYSKVLSLFLVKGMDTSLLNRMFDDLRNTILSDYVIGNNELKRDDALRQLKDIINYIGNAGIYIGQQNIIIVNYAEALKEKVRELTQLIYDALKNPKMREDAISICEFIIDHIMPYIEVPSEILRYKIINAINTLISEFPSSNKSRGKEFDDALTKLRNYTDIIILSNKNEAFRKFFEEHKEEFESATAKQIENIVRKAIKEFVKKGIVVEEG